MKSILGLLLTCFSWTAQAQVSTAHKATEDATLIMGFAENFATSSGLKLSWSTGSTFEPSYRGLVKFAVSGVSGSVTNVKARFYVDTLEAGCANTGPRIFQTSTAWSESTVAYHTRPATISAALDDVVTGVSAGTYIDYNVTSVVQGNGDYSFVVMPDSACHLTLSSREGSRPPELIVTTGGAVSPAPVVYNYCMTGIGVFQHGESFTAWEAYSPPSGSFCKSEVRKCTDGVLSGSFDFKYCVGPVAPTPTPAPSPTPTPTPAPVASATISGMKATCSTSLRKITITGTLSANMYMQIRKDGSWVSIGGSPTLKGAFSNSTSSSTCPSEVRVRDKNRTSYEVRAAVTRVP